MRRKITVFTLSATILTEFQSTNACIIARKRCRFVGKVLIVKILLISRSILIQETIWILILVKIHRWRRTRLIDFRKLLESSSSKKNLLMNSNLKVDEDILKNCYGFLVINIYIIYASFCQGVWFCRARFLAGEATIGLEALKWPRN